MKVFNLVFIVLFIVFAGLQYNDPDPYIWMPLYLYGALLCFNSYKLNYRPLYFCFGFVIYGIYATYLLFADTGVLNWAIEHNGENIAGSMKASMPWIEKTREFFGLLILIIVLLMNMTWLRNKNRKIRSERHGS